MTSFITGLWQNIFEPGANEQLIIATHVSFAALLATLAWLIYVTRSIHFMALFGIGLCLWIAVIWFVQELKSVQLKNNEELMVENGDENEDEAGYCHYYCRCCNRVRVKDQEVGFQKSIRSLSLSLPLSCLISCGI